MNILLIGIDSKFIHTNMAIRYLKANCDFDVEIKEYTIKDDIEIIIQDIQENKAQIIGFSCYIWNINIIRNIAIKLKNHNRNLIIILGGPEISYEYDDYLINRIADYIIFNEGEIAFNQLIKAIINKEGLNNVPNLAYYKNNQIRRNKLEIIDNLKNLKNPYQLSSDKINISKKIQYIELSRGCPYKCSYCLASLEKGLRFFDLQEVFVNIDYLVEKGAKTIKFLDRSFNANKKLALDFFKILISKDYPSTIFQFEVNGDVLDQSIIDYLSNNLKKNYIRFELGIQSTNMEVNKAIDRHQDTLTLIKNIKSLQDSNIILHLDLIAGLPYEDLDSFKNTFNQIFILYAKELQLGFLKMLKGTNIRREANKHEYSYSTEPPYEIIKNRYLSEQELNRIHKVETFLEIYWNKGFMNNSIQELIKRYSNPFDFYLDLAYYYHENDLSYKKYQLLDVFDNLIKFLKHKGLYDYQIENIIKLDYLAYHKIKPKIYWKNDFKKQDIIRDFFEINKNHVIDQLYKYSLVTRYKEGFLIVLYLPKEQIFYHFYNNQTKRISLN